MGKSTKTNKSLLAKLRNRVLTLRRNNLITDAEQQAIINTKRGKDKIQSDLFNLLMEKDINTSFWMLELLRNEAANKGSLTNAESVEFLQRPKNPLQIAGIIQCVFTFLPLEDIKNCRLVSKEWNYVGEPFFRKLSQVFFCNPAFPPLSKKSENDFKRTFEHCQTSIPFTALRLARISGNSAPWSKYALEKIINEWGKNLKQLTISGDIEVGRSKQFSFSMLNLSSDVLITKLNICPPTSNFIFTLEKLFNLKSFRIEGCKLKIPDDNEISPAEVEIISCSILYKEMWDRSEFNQFIDFNKTKRFTYRPEEILEPRRIRRNVAFSQSEMKLNLMGNFQVELLDLKNSCILNWDMSNWKVDKMILTKTKFLGWPEIQVRDLDVDFYCRHSYYIPESVEKLTCRGTEINTTFLSLKHLAYYPRQFQHRIDLKHYPFLKKLELRRENNYNFTEINWLPPTIKHLLLKGQIKLAFEERMTFDTLVLDSYSIDSGIELFQQFNATQNVWRWPNDEKSLEKIFQFLQNTDIKIAVGNFNWYKYSFKRKSLLLDKESPYYLFENKVGVAIRRKQFEQRVKL